MNIPRTIPALLLKDGGFVKTLKFKSPVYLGDPLNTLRIFNDLEVDEVVVFGITPALRHSGPDFEYLTEMAAECFMPMGYGGGVSTLAQMERLYSLGMEKVVLSSAAFARPELVQEAAARFGRQSVVVCLDYRKKLFGGACCVTENAGREWPGSVADWAKRFEDAGAGELILQSVDRDGTRKGYDLAKVKAVTSAVSVPVIACGGAGQVEDLRSVVREAGAAGAAAGSLFVFQRSRDSVLISYPERSRLEKLFSES